MANSRPIFTFTAHDQIEVEIESCDGPLSRRLLNRSTCTIFPGVDSDDMSYSK